LNNLDTIPPSSEDDGDEITIQPDLIAGLQEALAENAGKPKPAGTKVDGLVLKKRPAGEAGAPAKAGAPVPRGAGGPKGAGGRTAGGPPVRTGPSPNAQKRMDRFSRVLPSRDPGVRMNEQIRVPEIRLIGDDGQMIGVMSPREALELARSKGQDLIEIVPNAKPPVCKIMDFGKWKYEQQKKDKLAKKSSHQQLMKEIRFHPHTDTHDFEFKLRHARSFIEEGHKVKAYVQFKGREVTYKQFGEELLSNFKARMEDIAKIDQDVSMMGRMMSMVLSPSGKKKAGAEGNNKDDEKPLIIKKKSAVKTEVAEEHEDLGPDFSESSVDMDDATETSEDTLS
jgi:translation initiation factor IF-3